MPLQILSGDIRKLAKRLGAETKQLREDLRQILIEETEVTVASLRTLASGGAVEERSGKLARAAGMTIQETPYTFTVELGYINPEDERTAIRAAVLSGVSGGQTFIEAQEAEYLAIPIRDLSPEIIFEGNPDGPMGPGELDELGLYHMVYTESAIMGRELNSTVQELVFLYLRRYEVTVDVKIPLDKILDELINRIRRKLGI